MQPIPSGSSIVGGCPQFDPFVPLTSAASESSSMGGFGFVIPMDFADAEIGRELDFFSIYYSCP
jgi:hypothetical protein